GSPSDLSGAPSQQGEITLTWSAATDPESGITEYVIYRDDSEVGRTADAGYVDGSLQDDRQYSYKVSAVNGQGLEGSPAGPIQVQTLSDAAPEPPRDLTADATGPDAVVLDWRSPSDDDDIEGYRVYRDGAPIATTSRTEYEDSGLAPFTTYTYTVTTLDEDGDESAPSNAAVVTTRDGTPPTTPRGLLATAVGTGRIDLSWTPAEDAESGVLYYRVLRGDVEIGTSESAAFQDEGLEPSTTYEYRVSAVNGDGGESPLSDPASATTADGSGPSTPEDLTALAVATDGIDLNWSASTDDESGIAYYRVFRDGDAIGTSPVTSYQDAGLAASTTYEYRVSAVNGENLESGLSESASATTLDEPGPPAPVDLTATPLSTTNVELTWSAPAETITGYNVYRDGAFVGSVAATTFIDTGLAPETTYRYQVASVVEDVQGERSAEVEATTLSEEDRIPPAPPTGLRLVAP
ncbi:MAG: fibronectin type III domain-containing protein, partial [marine benthic group bacterium]|nr:fibronectin type III domain-containing protein [Candidatus Benthicola marisminoris]